MRRGRQPGRRRLACTPLPVLRRPDDHRRDVRRPAPLAFPCRRPRSGSTAHDRRPHAAAHCRSPSPPAARRNTSAMPAPVSPVLLRPTRTSRSRASSSSKTAAVAASAENTERRQPPSPRSKAVRNSQIPIGAPDKRSPYLPAVSSLGGFRTPAPRPRTTAPQGAGVRNPRMRAREVVAPIVGLSANSDYPDGCAPCQPRIRRDPAIPNHDPCIREKEFLAAGPIFTSAP